MAVLLTRRLSFNVARRLHNPALSDEENRRLYGAANNPHGFGHNLALEATVTGEVDPVDGMVLNLVDRNLNLDVPPFDRVPPTAENVAAWIWERVAAALPERVELAHVRLQVTPDFRIDLGDPRLGAAL